MTESNTPAIAPAGRRHYGLDWLRIAAFALLILYHIGMVFSPWAWVIHAPYSHSWLIVPMSAVTPWRLPLLFAVSGYASRALLGKSGGARGFLRARGMRLLVPLAFGMVVLVPVEMWVLVMEDGYPRSFLHFWTHDYFRWGEFYGREFPSWEHLWFLAYLSAYTFALGAALAWRGARVLALLDRLAGWMAQGLRLLWVPAAALMWFKLSMMFVIPERQGLVTDWTGHALYLPCFLFGFVLCGAPRLWPVIARLWKPALALALAAGAIDVAIELTHPGNAPIGHAMMALDRAARVACAWGTILALFHLADRGLNRDHRWRRTLSEAVFPFYLIHHPVIVLIVWYSLPLGLGAWSLFALLLGGTLAAGSGCYLIGRRIGWLRPLIGLASKPRAEAPAAAERLAAG